MSSQNLTITDIRTTFRVMLAWAKDAGVDVDRWRLTEGSSTYGNSWAVVDVDPETGGQRTVARFGFTRRNAYDGLRGMADAFKVLAPKEA